MRIALFALCGLAASCASPQPAPKDLDGLARFFFDRFDPKDEDPAISDQELQDAIVKLDDVINGSKITDPTKGTLANLTQDELDAVGLAGKPDKPQGMFITDVVKCDLDKLETIVLTPDQLSLYPEAYASYHRDMDKDAPAFLPTWTLTYKSSENALITNQFTAIEKSGLRKVPDGAAVGPFIEGRVFMPKPAVFEDPNPSVEFSNDFQVELYYARKPGELVHFYGMWRYMHLGALGESYDALFIDQTTGGMIDWDKKTEALCAK